MNLPLRSVLFRGVLAVALVLGVAGSAAYDNSRYDNLFEVSGRRQNVSPTLLKAIALHESGLNPKARGAANEYGLMQILPSTARAMGLPLHRAMDPATNIDYAARLVRENIALFHSWQPSLDLEQLATLVIAAYNAGPESAFRGRYSEAYVASVRAHWRRLGGGSLSYDGSLSSFRPTADVRLVDVLNLSSDSMPEPGDRIVMTFAFRWEQHDGMRPHLILEARNEDMVLQADAQLRKVRQGGEWEIAIPAGSSGEFRFEVNAIVHSVADARILVRSTFRKADGQTGYWPWVGVAGHSQLPMRSIFVFP